MHKKKKATLEQLITILMRQRIFLPSASQQLPLFPSLRESAWLSETSYLGRDSRIFSLQYEEKDAGQLSLEICSLRLREQLVIQHSYHAGSAKNTLSILACFLFCFVFRLRCQGKKQYRNAVPSHPAFSKPMNPLSCPLQWRAWPHLLGRQPTSGSRGGREKPTRSVLLDFHSKTGYQCCPLLQSPLPKVLIIAKD